MREPRNANKKNHTLGRDPATSIHLGVKVMKPSAITLVSAADDGYAMPLGITIRSMLDTLATESTVELFVLDGGLSEINKNRLQQSWNDSRLTVHWLSCPLDVVRDLMVSQHVTATAYLRLLMHTLLPENISKVLYVDADMLIRRDVGLLWGIPFDGNVVMAVCDAGAPVLDAKIALPVFQRCRKRLSSCCPIQNYRELGLSPHHKYFNSGMMLVDLTEWRNRRIGERALRVMRDHKQHVLWWDQYALNVVLAGQWGEVDGRWNQVAAIYRYRTWRQSPFDRATFDAMRNDPWVVHFSSARKPWHAGSNHPWTGDYRATIPRTAWHPWQPIEAAQPRRASPRVPLTSARRRFVSMLRALWRSHETQRPAA